MKLKNLQWNYEHFATISKSKSSYGKYEVKLKHPINHVEFFDTLADVATFLNNHVKDLRSRNCL